MLRKFLLGIMVVSMASLAWAGVPDPGNSEVAFAGPAGSLMHIRPNGTGTPFTAVIPPGGGAGVDGTITLTLRDANGQPVFNWPWEDMWLEASFGAANVAFCAEIPSRPNGGSTDNNGETFWSGNLFGGGHGGYNKTTELGGINVMVGGTAMFEVPYFINSPDNNGDLVVDALDVGPFFGAWGSTDQRYDYNWDGIIDALDVGPLFGAWGAACPIDP